MSTGSRDAWNENEWSKELFPPSLSPSSSPLCLCSDDLEDDPESSIMAVSYHNMAVEHEHLGEYDKAMQAYFKSVEVATQELGEGHPVTEAFRGRWEAAQLSAEARQKKDGGARGNKLSEYDKKIVSTGKLGKGSLAAKATPRGR